MQNITNLGKFSNYKQERKDSSKRLQFSFPTFPNNSNQYSQITFSLFSFFFFISSKLPCKKIAGPTTETIIPGQREREK